MPRSLRLAATGVAGLLVAVVVLALALRWLGPLRAPWQAALVALVPELVALNLVAAGAFATLRIRSGAVLALLIGAVLIATQVAPFRGAAGAGATRGGFVLMSANLRLGLADPASVVATVRREQVDVLALQELTEQAVAGLRAAGLERTLPHAVLAPAVTSTGNGLWSRYPLEAGGPMPALANPPAGARLVLAAGVPRPLVVSVHPVAPWPDGIAEWNRDLAELRRWLPTGSTPTVVAGDFNATRDHAPFRRLLGAGYADAASALGAGLVRTYPAGPGRLPLLGIDHVLTGGRAAPAAFRTVPVRGSDHRALLARIVLR